MLWANNVGLTSSSAITPAYRYSSWDTFGDVVEWNENYFHDAMNISQSNQVTFVKMPENPGDGYDTTPATDAL